MTILIGIKISDKIASSSEFEGLLFKFGCIIKTRIEFRSTCKTSCSDFKIIILEFVDSDEVIQFKKLLSGMSEATFGVIEL